MRVLVTGSTGLIGSALVSSLRAEGHEVVCLVRPRGQLRAGEIRWDPAAEEIDAEALEGLDAVVHLAGEPIPGIWTTEKKARILNSRKQGTRLLAETLAARRARPAVLVSTSAIGYYGDRADQVLTEESPPGEGFLPEVCQAWEAATAPAAEAGVRVAILRFGMVLAAEGGALPEMIRPFRLGVGGRLGSGQQWVSWIALDDLLGAIGHALATETLRGPANAVSPQPARNAEMARLLGKVLGRPALVPVPAFALRLAFGQMGQETLLASARVEPARLLATGYTFRYPNLEDALRHVLNRAGAQ